MRTNAIRHYLLASTLALTWQSVVAAQGAPPTPPSITQYRPTSTLIVPTREIRSAKFPAVDFHGHPPTLDSDEVIRSVMQIMDSLNIAVMVVASPSAGERLSRQIDAVRRYGASDRFAFFASLDLRNIRPGSGARLAAQLERDILAGAVGIGEIQQDFGLRLVRADGSRLALDEPELDTVWAMAAKYRVPVFIHTGDPPSFFQPMTWENERWLELSMFEQRRYFDRTRFPTFDSLMAERERLFLRHPNTTFVAAHMGWFANDLARLGALLDKCPNVFTEVGAILYELGRQPRTARRFFEQYGDRVLFGKDLFAPSEYPYYWRVFETDDEYFDYYRPYHAFWKLYGMNLPDQVLRKLYQENAARITPGVAGKLAERGKAELQNR